MILFLDNYDSFTYNLVDYFKQLGQECYIVHNDEPLENTINKEFQSLVISPGPGTPKLSGHLFDYLNYYQDKLPVMGICLGHQAICEYFGSTIQQALQPMHGKISKILVKEDMLFKEIPEYISVVRYHSLIGKGLSNELKIIAETEEDEVMAVRHIQKPIWGIQYHPEAALTEYGLKVIKNWLQATGQLR